MRVQYGLSGVTFGVIRQELQQVRVCITRRFVKLARKLSHSGHREAVDFLRCKETFMSKMQQDAAIQKWFSYIDNDKKRENEIGRVRENIRIGIITYSEWVKATLLINRIDQVNDKEASIELLNTLNGKLHPRIGNGDDHTKFIESLLAYFVGKHSKEDINRFTSGSKPEKPAKNKVEKREKAAQSKFFGNW